MEKFKSMFSNYASVLSPGFTERDCTPPGWERIKPKNTKEETKHDTSTREIQWGKNFHR